MRSMEYPPIEDMNLEDMWGGLDFPPLSFPLSRDAVIAAGSAGVGMMLASWGTKKVNFLKTPNWRAAASVAGGLLGAYLMYDYNRPAATGFAAGAVGLGLATLLLNFVNMPVTLEKPEEVAAREAKAASKAVAGLGYSNDDLLGLGLGDAVVDEETMLTGLDAGDDDLFGIEDAETEVVPPYELTSLL